MRLLLRIKLVKTDGSGIQSAETNTDIVSKIYSFNILFFQCLIKRLANFSSRDKLSLQGPLSIALNYGSPGDNSGYARRLNYLKKAQLLIYMKGPLLMSKPLFSILSDLYKIR